MIKKFDESENQYSHFWKKKHASWQACACWKWQVLCFCYCVCCCLFVCLFCFLAFTSDSIIQFEKKSLETILLFCLGQHRRHSTFNFPSITDVSITGAGRAHPFEDSFRKLWRESDKRSGLGCSKAGQRYPPNKSLSSG